MGDDPLYDTVTYPCFVNHPFATSVASRERLPFRTPGSVSLLGVAYDPIVETKFLELAITLTTPCYFLDFAMYPLCALTLLDEAPQRITIYTRHMKDFNNK